MSDSLPQNLPQFLQSSLPDAFCRSDYWKPGPTPRHQPAPGNQEDSALFVYCSRQYRSDLPWFGRWSTTHSTQRATLRFATRRLHRNLRSTFKSRETCYTRALHGDIRIGWQETLSRLSHPDQGFERQESRVKFGAEQCCVLLRSFNSIVMAALAQSDARLAKLEMPTMAYLDRDRLWKSTPHALGICTAVLSQQPKALADLCRMRFHCLQCEHDALRLRSQDRCVDIAVQKLDLPRVLSMMPKLTSLHLTRLGRPTWSQDITRGRDIAQSLSSVRLPCLETIEMTHSTVDQGTMEQFYMNHSTTLRKIELMQLHLYAGWWSWFPNWLSRDHAQCLSALYFDCISDSKGLVQNPETDSASRLHLFCLQGPMLREQLDRVASIADCVWR